MRRSQDTHTDCSNKHAVPDNFLLLKVASVRIVLLAGLAVFVVILLLQFGLQRSLELLENAAFVFGLHGLELGVQSVQTRGLAILSAR